MGDNFQRVEDLDARVRAKGQTHAAAKRLLGKDLGDAGAHRGDDVDVADIPALFEHAHRDDDSDR